jgi:hypothetical protein
MRVMRRTVLAFSARNRRRKATAIVAFMDRVGAKSVLLCGAVGSGTQPNEAIVERTVAAHAGGVLAVDVEDRGPQPWPFMVADGRDLPLADDQFDLALANAVIEHVGDAANQRKFVAEQARVARDWVITTPNRWFPVESHTSAVLRHWSPAWRQQRTEFTRLLSRREFAELLPDGARIVGRAWSATFTAFSR